ncbi:MAG: winged helix-turn-helix domain-containing protein [Candidatus Methanofastidiosia archaeon]
MRNKDLEQQRVIELLEEMRDDISLIRTYMEFQVSDFVRDRLDKTASTLERKQVWILLDGTRTTSEIAEIVGVSSRTVQYFVKQLRDSNLVWEKQRGYLQKKINLTPSEWEGIEEALKSKIGEEER